MSEPPFSTIDHHHLLGGLSPKQFLTRFWQKKPLLVRGAIPGFTSPLAPEELAGLACEPEVESRLVLERGGTSPWELRHGPFPEAEFAGMGTTHWTLLVQDVDKHVPYFSRLIDLFRFIPDWRIEDLMVSYAAKEGTVGPHTDEYDVFLIQAMGQRRWGIGSHAAQETDWVPDVELRILRKFQADQEWVLAPGDLLYLPPGIAHHGVALEPGMTYSIGFRAPSHREMVMALFDRMIERIDAHARYRDPDLAPQAEPGLISREARQQARSILRAVLSAPDQDIDAAFASLVTEPKPHCCSEPPDETLSARQFSYRCQSDGLLCRAPFSRFAYLEPGPKRTLLYVDGAEFALDDPCQSLAPLLSKQRRFAYRALRPYLLQEQSLNLLTKLYNQGHMRFCDE